MSNNTFPFRFRVYNITSTIYTITCSVCILIGCWPWSIKGHTHRWHQISSAPKIFNKPIEFLSCKTNRLHFSVCVYCNRSQKTSQRVKNNSHATRLRLVLFLFFTRCDVMCDLLQYTRTQKCNLFVKYNMSGVLYRIYKRIYLWYEWM